MAHDLQLGSVGLSQVLNILSLRRGVSWLDDEHLSRRPGPMGLREAIVRVRRVCLTPVCVCLLVGLHPLDAALLERPRCTLHTLFLAIARRSPDERWCYPNVLSCSSPSTAGDLGIWEQREYDVSRKEESHRRKPSATQK
ncbi:Uu.00g013880.m01.CDS01 [Anthostomella pinea]|uniref:Uu.00g013880.m01.CDS01 n=1 Tax=Anthostomella pinea TaxID=933095 RepID=A0AAI8VY74_9PEZI|nr:Uu.00g013880.m01.CDS01 [Anthostomella pinea]